MSKYDAGGSQGRYQPGSNDQVLENKLGIIDPADRDEAELVLLEKLYVDVLLCNLPAAAISFADIKRWHHRWLGNLYEWAGEERSVNLGKGGFHFAAANQVPSLLGKFEREYLQAYTPCGSFGEDRLIEGLAKVHVEFILIHPFRDGNGRLSRLLADVMVAQAGHPPLDYTSWNQNKAEYFAAIREGLRFDYQPMMAWIRRAFSET